jgi:hypothetical protein
MIPRSCLVTLPAELSLIIAVSVRNVCGEAGLACGYCQQTGEMSYVTSQGMRRRGTLSLLTGSVEQYNSYYFIVCKRKVCQELYIYLLYMLYSNLARVYVLLVIKLSRVYCCYLVCICCTLCVHCWFLLYMSDCWLEVSIRKVLRPATSTHVFLSFPVSISKC